MVRLKSVIIISLFFLGNVCWSQIKVDSSRVVKILTFNILHGATTKGDFNLDVIAEVITKTNPDLVALQEVDFKTNRAKKYDLVTEIGWRTKMMPLFGKAMNYDGGEYGEGILSKYTFSQSRNVALPYTKGNEPRAALEVTTTLPSADTITFVATHLDHLADEKDRVSQAKKINEVFAKNNKPTILAGDLNAIPGSTPINILEKIWKPSYDKNNIAYTYPSNNPTSKIDYIMFYPKKKWRIIETKVIKNAVASDHCAYMVVAELLDK